MWQINAFGSSTATADSDQEMRMPALYTGRGSANQRQTENGTMGEQVAPGVSADQARVEIGVVRLVWC